MTDHELSKYKIIQTEDEGNCAIHSVLYGLQRVYTNKQIVDILNQYLDPNEQIKDLILDNEKPKVNYSTDTTNAVRQALYNYYHTYENDLHFDLMEPDTDPSTFTAENIEIFKSYGQSVELHNNSTNELPHYKNIIKDKVWLTDIDLYYICKLFDICIKLRDYQSNTYYWRYINPEIDKSSIGINQNKIFEQQCQKVVYIQFVNGNHFQVLIPKKLKGSVQNSHNKTSKRRSSPSLMSKRKYYTPKSKFQYNSNNNSPREPKSNNIILGGLAVTGIAIGVLVGLNY